MTASASYINLSSITRGVFIFLIGTDKEPIGTRLVAFFDLELQTEYPLATNLPAAEENAIFNNATTFAGGFKN
ncbi:hypothetical protein [Trichothermofontia sp.]